MADVIIFDASAFRAQFTAFASTSKYSDPTLQQYFNIATIYTTANVAESLLGDSQTQILYLLTAHMAGISDIVASKGTVGQVTSSSIGQVSISIEPPPSKDAFQYWLNLTPYGMQLLALLSLAAVGGMYIGGLPERDAFRKVYGIF